MKIKNVQFQIIDMDCASCAMNIDGELEDTKGVHTAKTNFTKQQTTVAYDENVVKEKELIAVIKKAGYTASLPDKN